MLHSDLCSVCLEMKQSQTVRSGLHREKGGEGAGGGGGSREVANAISHNYKCSSRSLLQDLQMLSCMCPNRGLVLHF